jgi:hypothetical protein
VKGAIILMLAGALVGIAVAAAVVPPLLGWYTSPGGLPQGAEVQAVVQIPEVIRYATSRLIFYQAIGGGLGALAGLVIRLLFRRRPAPPASSAPSVPSTALPPSYGD